MIKCRNNIHPRLKEFDALRGFSIFLVVYSHVLMTAGIGGDKSLVGEVITSFYMALFFFISGFFAWKSTDLIRRDNIYRLLNRKFKALVVSSIVFSTLLNYCLSGDALEWVHTGFRHYWFTIVLFQMFLLYLLSFFISRVIHRDITIFLMIGFSIVALGILRSHMLYESHPNHILGLDNLCYFLQFFTFGLLCKKYSSVFFKLLSKDVFISILIPGTVALYCITNIVNKSIPKLLLTFTTTYCAILLLVCLFYKSKRYFEDNGFLQNSLCTWGQRSLDIYMIHYFFLPNLLFIGHYLQPNDMAIFQIGIFGTISIFVIFICITISGCIRKSQTLSNWLFGVKKIMGQDLGNSVKE